MGVIRGLLLAAVFLNMGLGASAGCNETDNYCTAELSRNVLAAYSASKISVDDVSSFGSALATAVAGFGSRCRGATGDVLRAIRLLTPTENTEAQRRASQEFTRATGYRVEFTSQPAARIAEEVTFQRQTNVSLYDGWVLDSPSSEAFQRAHGVALLDDLVAAEDVRLLADEDVHPFFQEYAAMYDGHRTGIVVSGQVPLLYWRRDYFARHLAGLDRPPGTWEELLQVAAALNGTDFDGDGRPDAALCWQTEGCVDAYTVLSNILASMTQYRGRSSGWLLNPSDLAPLASGPPLERALELFRNLTRYEARGITGCLYTHSALFNGSCAMTVKWGHQFKVGELNHPGLHGSLGVAPLPGSTRVWDRDAAAWLDCAGDTPAAAAAAACPHADSHLPLELDPDLLARSNTPAAAVPGPPTLPPPSATAAAAADRRRGRRRRAQAGETGSGAAGGAGASSNIGSSSSSASSPPASPPSGAAVTSSLPLAAGNLPPPPSSFASSSPSPPSAPGGAGGVASAAGSGVRVNRAPYCGLVALAGSVDWQTPAEYKQGAFTFFALFASPNSSWTQLGIADSGVGPFRRQHLDPANVPRWLAMGYDSRDLQPFLAAWRDAIDHPNAAMPLRLPGTAGLQAALSWAAQQALLGEAAVGDIAAKVAEQLRAALATADADVVEIKRLYWATLGYSGPSLVPAGSGGAGWWSAARAARVGLGIGLAVTGTAVALLGGCWWYRRRRRLLRQTLFGKAMAPGASPATSLVVTDIVDSTRLWETVPPAAMARAVQLHHETLRLLLDQHNGYESATEGDSFILSFYTAADAVSFALRAQAALMMQPWPEELLREELCRPQYAVCRAPGGALDRPRSGFPVPSLLPSRHQLTHGSLPSEVLALSGTHSQLTFGSLGPAAAASVTAAGSARSGSAGAAAGPQDFAFNPAGSSGRGGTISSTLLRLPGTAAVPPRGALNPTTPGPLPRRIRGPAGAAADSGAVLDAPLPPPFRSRPGRLWPSTPQLSLEALPSSASVPTTAAPAPGSGRLSKLHPGSRADHARLSKQLAGDSRSRGLSGARSRSAVSEEMSTSEATAAMVAAAAAGTASPLGDTRETAPPGGSKRPSMAVLLQDGPGEAASGAPHHGASGGAATTTTTATGGGDGGGDTSNSSSTASAAQAVALGAGTETAPHGHGRQRVLRHLRHLLGGRQAGAGRRDTGPASDGAAPSSSKRKANRAMRTAPAIPAFGSRGSGDEATERASQANAITGNVAAGGAVATAAEPAAGPFGAGARFVDNPLASTADPDTDSGPEGAARGELGAAGGGESAAEPAGNTTESNNAHYGTGALFSSQGFAMSTAGASPFMSTSAASPFMGGKPGGAGGVVSGSVHAGLGSLMQDSTLGTLFATESSAGAATLGGGGGGSSSVGMFSGTARLPSTVTRPDAAAVGVSAGNSESLVPATFTGYTRARSDTVGPTSPTVSQSASGAMGMDDHPPVINIGEAVSEQLPCGPQMPDGPQFVPGRVGRGSAPGADIIASGEVPDGGGGGAGAGSGARSAVRSSVSRALTSASLAGVLPYRRPTVHNNSTLLAALMSNGAISSTALESIVTTHSGNVAAAPVTIRSITLGAYYQQLYRVCPPTEPGAVMVSGGLQIRIGVHSGVTNTQVSYNRVAGRTQYSGAALEGAKSVGDAAQGGMVLLSRPALEQLTRPGGGGASPGGRDVQHVLLDMGSHVIKAWPEAVQLYMAQSHELMARLAFLGPVRSSAQEEAGVMEAPLGEVSMAALSVVGLPTLLAWDKDATEEALATFRRVVVAGAMRSLGGHLVEEAQGGVLAAFGHPYDAIRWVAACEAMLKEADWSEALLGHELAEEVQGPVLLNSQLDAPVLMADTDLPRMLFRGLRIKGAVDCAAVKAELVPATGRVAYRGNLAHNVQRIAAYVSTGQVVCTRRAWRGYEASIEDAALVSGASEVVGASLGCHSIRGVGDKIELWSVRLAEDMVYEDPYDYYDASFGHGLGVAMAAAEAEEEEDAVATAAAANPGIMAEVQAAFALPAPFVSPPGSQDLLHMDAQSHPPAARQGLLAPSEWLSAPPGSAGASAFATSSAAAAALREPPADGSSPQTSDLLELRESLTSERPSLTLAPLQGLPSPTLLRPSSLTLAPLPPQSVAPQLMPSPSLAPPRLAPSPSLAPPRLAPSPSFAPPRFAPSPSLALPRLAPSPSLALPRLAPSPSLTPPRLAPSPSLAAAWGAAAGSAPPASLTPSPSLARPPPLVASPSLGAAALGAAGDAAGIASRLGLSLAGALRVHAPSWEVSGEELRNMLSE